MHCFPTLTRRSAWSLHLFFCCFSLAHLHSATLPTLIGCGQISFVLSIFQQVARNPSLVFLTSMYTFLCTVHVCAPVSVAHIISEVADQLAGWRWLLFTMWALLDTFSRMKLNHAYLVDQFILSIKVFPLLI